MSILFRRLTRCTVIAGVLLVAPHRTPVAAAQERSNSEQERGISQVTTRFADTLSLTRAKGAATPMRVEMKQWHLAGQGVPIEIREQGFYIAYLAWGNVSVQVGDGAATVKAPGDFWTVEKGTRMVVTIKKPGEDALVQTFAVNPVH